MNKVKLFLENFIIYGFGGVISKIVPLLMVPIITRLMPNSEYYAVSDLSNTILSFASAVAVLGMYDGMYRMFFEKDDIEFKKNVCSTTLFFAMGMSVITSVLLVVFRHNLARIAFGTEKYHYVIYITAIATLVTATNQIISAPTRMQNKRKVFLFTNTIGPILSYGIAIPMLLKGHYIIALPLAGVLSGVTMELSFYVMNRQWFDLRRFDKNLLKQILQIAIPLFPNFIVYWLFGSADKLMITNMIGLGAAGIYSVGAKLGHASQLIRTAFGGGWQFFAFSTMNEDNQVKNNSLVFEYLGLVAFICSMFVFALSKPIYQILFEKEYISGYIVSPYLFLAPLLQMLFQVAANQFIVVKKTWPNMLILSIGVVANIILNLLLIPKLGIEGAAIATLMGYVVSDIICVIVLYRMRLIELSFRFYIVVLLMTGFIVTWRLVVGTNVVASTLFAVVLTLVFMWLYRKDIEILIKGFKK